MSQWKPLFAGAATAAAFLLAGGTGQAAAAASGKRAFVDLTVSSQLLPDSIRVLDAANSIDRGTGALAIAAITLTDSDTSTQQLLLLNPIFTAGGTYASSSVGGSVPKLAVYETQASTFHLACLSPLIAIPSMVRRALEQTSPGC